ncbi:MAG: AAA-like domain-containing protein [Jaaginema sp. PMC 1079.18]|nr:AAA-like domain-containing protein [Jaaginema sp. PMC 1080.18]MEC4851007.1 AAA-like domain-containing protein [Jaaginema sp. PMC 1079.18]MEC4868289.1 AAA-like domain-containing protein [Jaaginema sp. PMC 1078.18]
MNVDNVLLLVEQTLLKRSLTPIERLVLQQSWLNYSYIKIAENSSYVSGYIKEVGSQLWQELSEAVGDRVTKKNLRLVLKEYYDGHLETSVCIPDIYTVDTKDNRDIIVPGTPLTTDSPLYINHPAIETPVFNSLQQPGCAIRIKGPQKTGKTSLLNSILQQAQTLKYHTAIVHFHEAEKDIFASLDRYLRWFCANVSHQLNLKSCQDDFWDENMGSKVSCKIYFEAYLLKQINRPVAIAFDEVHRLFDYPEIAQEFLPMLRFWHEQAQRSPTWQKLRLIIAYTSESSLPLRLNQSPFNVGIVVKVPPFNLTQIQDLAHRYALPNMTGEEGKKRLAPLAAMVGGHPYLVHIALYNLYLGRLSLPEILNSAPTLSGVYSNYLRHYLALVQSDPSLVKALHTVIADDRQVALDAIAAYKLESMGLVHLDGYQAQFSCDLYRLYFTRQLEALDIPVEMIPGTETTNDSHFDGLTKLLNRQYFQRYLTTQWPIWQNKNSQIAAILCEIDYFTLYNRIHGSQVGDRCLQIVANTIKTTFRSQALVIARYTGLRFIALFPDLDLKATIAIAEKGRLAVRELAISYENPSAGLGGFHSQTLTTSLGVVVTALQASDNPTEFLHGLEQALYLAQRNGRDRVETYPPEKP